MKHLVFILTIFGCFILTGCFDIFERTYWSDDHYSVWDNPGNISSKTLYYVLDTGSGHGRVNYVSQIGSNKRYIVVESTKSKQEKEYWILDKSKDEPLLNADEIIEGPFNLTNFQLRKIELKINNLNFEKKIK
jgi:hypothetical protein